MNAKKLIAAVAVFAATGSVFAAQTYPYVDFSDVQSTKSRAEVIAELQQAQEDGSYALAHQEFEGQLPLVNDGDAGTRLARNEGQAARTN